MSALLRAGSDALATSVSLAARAVGLASEAGTATSVGTTEVSEAGGGIVDGIDGRGVERPMRNQDAAAAVESSPRPDDGPPRPCPRLLKEPPRPRPLMRSACSEGVGVVPRSMAQASGVPGRRRP